MCAPARGDSAKETRGFCGSADRLANKTWPPPRNALGHAALFSSYATFSRAPSSPGTSSPPGAPDGNEEGTSSCRNLTLHYFEAGIGTPHWAKQVQRASNPVVEPTAYPPLPEPTAYPPRRSHHSLKLSGLRRSGRHLALPTALTAVNSSSIVLLSIGTHGNTAAELHALWQRDVAPFLALANRSSGGGAEGDGGSTPGSTPGSAPASVRRHDLLHSIERSAEGDQAVGGSTPGSAPASMHRHDLVHTRTPPRVLWVGIPPQHFPTERGSGLYAERQRGPCAPTLNESAARWRETLFQAWLAPRRPVTRDADVDAGGWSEGWSDGRRDGHRDGRRDSHMLLWRQTSFFHIYNARADLHSRFDPKVQHVPMAAQHSSDCTHYCYSPWLYQPMWAIALHALSDAGLEVKK